MSLVHLLVCDDGLPYVIGQYRFFIENEGSFPSQSTPGTRSCRNEMSSDYFFRKTFRKSRIAAHVLWVLYIFTLQCYVTDKNKL
jgi:hypothetical protein